MAIIPVQHAQQKENIMTKSDFITKLAEKCQCPRPQAEKILSAFLNGVEDGLSADKKLSLKGFGTLEIRLRKAHAGINPSTREKIEIPASNTVVFRPADTLKNMIKG